MTKLIAALFLAALPLDAQADDFLIQASQLVQSKIEKSAKDKEMETCNSINTGLSILHDSHTNLKNTFDIAAVASERIGIDMGKTNEVAGVLKGGAAEKAGLKPGIRIFQVNGKDTTGLTGGQIREMISAATGKVEVLAGYPTEPKPRKITIVKTKTPIFDAATAKTLKAGMIAFDKKLDAATAKRRDAALKCSQSLLDEVSALVYELDAMRRGFEIQRMERYTRRPAGTDA